MTTIPIPNTDLLASYREQCPLSIKQFHDNIQPLGTCSVCVVYHGLAAKRDITPDPFRFLLCCENPLLFEARLLLLKSLSHSVLSNTLGQHSDPI